MVLCLSRNHTEDALYRAKKIRSYFPSIHFPKMSDSVILHRYLNFKNTKLSQFHKIRLNSGIKYIVGLSYFLNLWNTL